MPEKNRGGEGIAKSDGLRLGGVIERGQQVSSPPDRWSEGALCTPQQGPGQNTGPKFVDSMFR